MRTALAALLLILAFAPALDAHAQDGGLTLLPRVGLLTQTRSFAIPFDDPPPEYRQIWRYRFAPDLAFGLALEARTAFLPMPLRFEVNRVPALTLEQRSGSFGPPLYGPASGSVTTATTAAVIEPRSACVSGVCPRLLFGAGVKRYGFDATLVWDDVLDRFADDQLQPTLHLGAGVRIATGRFSLFAEANDFASRFRFSWRDESRGRVHDTLLTVGAGYTLR